VAKQSSGCLRWDAGKEEAVRAMSLVSAGGSVGVGVYVICVIFKTHHPYALCSV
jgi:hypothetical protein